MNVQARSCVAPQRGERGRGRAALRRGDALRARSGCGRPPRCGRAWQPCRRGRASARRSCGERLRGPRVRSALGRERDRVAWTRARPRGSASRRSSRPRTRSRSISATCSACTCERALPDPPEVACCAQIEIPVIAASSATIAMIRRCARRGGRARSLVESRSRATPRSSAGTYPDCGGSASLERGTLTLKLGMPSAENGACASWSLHADRRRARRSAPSSLRRPRRRPAATRVTRASAVASIPARLPRAVPEVGRAPTACRGSCWPRSARSSRATGATPGAYVPHTRGVLGPMQFQAGSNKAARRVDSAGDQGFGGTWGIWRRSSGHPPYRMDDPDDEIAAAAAKIAVDAGTRAALAARALALQRAALLPQDRAAARGAPRHELGLRPARRVGAGAARAAAPPPRRPGARPCRRRRPRRRACSPTTRSPSRPPPPTTSPTASPTGGSSRCWPGSPSATASS